MSGGSFDYLYTREADNITNYQETIRSMASALDALGYKEAAAKTVEIGDVVREFELFFDGIPDEFLRIWRAVEWYSSGDSVEDSIRQADEKWKEEMRNMI